MEDQVKQGKYVLLAWADYEAMGGLNDCCGWFEDVAYALNFFNESDHCKYKDAYQIIDTASWEVVLEGER